MEILIAGAGCLKCQAVEKIVKEVVEEINLNANVSHLYDVRQFAKYGVTITPAVLINGKVIMSGKIPTKEEIKKLLTGG